MLNRLPSSRPSSMSRPSTIVAIVAIAPIVCCIACSAACGAAPMVVSGVLFCVWRQRRLLDCHSLPFDVIFSRLAVKLVSSSRSTSGDRSGIPARHHRVAPRTPHVVAILPVNAARSQALIPVSAGLTRHPSSIVCHCRIHIHIS